ncbi:MAG: preprotein translocase subunit SecE [Thermoanaerobaculia bacterium]
MNWWTKTVEFLSEVRTEMRKVSFPAREEVVSTTIVVVVTSVVFAAFLFVADRLIIWGYQGIVRTFG